MSVRLRPSRLSSTAVVNPGSCTIEPRCRAAALLRCCVFAASLVASTAAMAADFPARPIGDWVVSQSSDSKGCFLSRTYPAPRRTTLQLGLDTDGGNRLTMLNTRWSIRPRDRLTLDFRLSSSAFPSHAAIGIASQGAKGFVTSFGRTFPAALASSRILLVERDGIRVEKVDLDGRRAASADLHRCVDQLRRTSGAPRPMRDGDRIPADPFAASVGRDSRR